MIDDALYTISTPENTMPSTVKKRIQSVLSRCAISIFGLQAVHNLLEDFSAMLVALELIEAGAGRCQQHRVAGRGIREGMPHSGIERLRIDELDGSRDLFGDLA